MWSIRFPEISMVEEITLWPLLDLLAAFEGRDSDIQEINAWALQSNSRSFSFLYFLKSCVKSIIAPCLLSARHMQHRSEWFPAHRAARPSVHNTSGSIVRLLSAARFMGGIIRSSAGGPQVFSPQIPPHSGYYTYSYPKIGISENSAWRLCDFMVSSSEIQSLLHHY